MNPLEEDDVTESRYQKLLEDGNGPKAMPKLLEALHDRIRLWPVADDVAEVPDRVDVAGVGEHGFEGDEIGMDVRQDRDAHSGEPSARAGRRNGRERRPYQGFRLRTAGSRGHIGARSSARRVTTTRR